MKDKKHLILTIIGITGMLILIFGATFAYFGVTFTNDEGKTQVDIDAGDIGSISLSNPTPNLHLSLSADDMTLDNVGEYYATNDSSKYYDETQIPRDIALATLTGGTNDLVYECSITIKINLNADALASLKEGDAYVQFGGLLTDKIDLTKISSDGYSTTFYLNTELYPSKNITAYIALTNKTDNQAYLAGKNISVNITNEGFNCMLTELENKTNTSTDSSLAISDNYRTELNTFKIYGNSIQNGTPTPDAPVEVQSLGNYDSNTGKYVVPITVSGKNKFDISNVNLTGLNASALNKVPKVENGLIYSGGRYGSSEGACLYIDTLGKSNWTISFNANYSETEEIRVYRIYLFNEIDENNYIVEPNRLTTIPVANNNNTTVDATGYKYIGIIFYSTNQYGLEISNLQFEEGSIKTNYEPYVEPVTQNIYLNEPLRKVGNTSDYIDFANKKVIINIKETILNGTENWGLPGTILDGYSSYRIVNFFENSPVDEFLCSHFETKSNVYYSSYISNIATSFLETSQLIINVSSDIANSLGQTDTSAWKNWLDSQKNNNTPVKLYQQLLNPIEQSIDLPNIPIFDQTTIIEVGTEIAPSSIEANYLIEP